MVSKKIEHLIAKYLSYQATAQELDELEAWVAKPENKTLFDTYVKVKYGVDYNLKTFNKNKVKAKLHSLIKEESRVIQLKKNRKYFEYAAAVLVVGLMAFAYYYKDVLFDAPSLNTPQITNINIIEPGTQKAVLTLEDGAQVVLQKGKRFATQKVTSNGEEIVYSAEKATPEQPVYNYITIPRGGEYAVKLSDGTMVWLNSETQLKYPVHFPEGQTREVELVYGEAYFDVTPSKANNGTKFMVLHNHQQVEVLGTEFNIKAYKDESNIYTTLVKGSVGVQNDLFEKELVPGQQSDLDLATNAFSVREVDVYNEVSWKEGVFSFERKSLADIMKVLARWYDFNVIFKTEGLENEKFIGVLGRDQKIEDILKTIRGFGIIKKYKINDKTIVLE